MIERLRHRDDFARLRSEGRRTSSGLLWCRYAPQPEGPPQVAFALSRKVGNAVSRNRIRRRLRPILDGLPVGPGQWLFGVTGQPGAAQQLDTLSSAELEALVEELLRAATRRSRP